MPDDLNFRKLGEILDVLTCDFGRQDPLRLLGRNGPNITVCIGVAPRMTRREQIGNRMIRPLDLSDIRLHKEFLAADTYRSMSASLFVSVRATKTSRSC